MTSDTANAAQREFWNTVAGPKWVGMADVMERRMGDINDLLLAEASAAAGEAVLDVGCGTGTTTLPLSRAVGPRGSVLGIDISETMLATARQRLAALNIDNAELLLADAQTHPFAAERFDLVASRFGVMFFEEPVAAFGNLRRSMRPDGRLCFVCWAPMGANPHWKLPLDIVVRHLGPPSPPPAHAPGPMAFSDVAYVRGILAAAGFAEVTITTVGTHLMGASLEDEVDFACSMGPPAALIGERQPRPEVVAAIRREVSEAFAEFAGPDGLRFPASVHVVKARRG